MTLNEYRRKRSFEKTPEPSGAKQAKSKKTRRSFVIQKHAASHLHYDFRLEHNGVLLSWAVPKGPSLDPKVKRLAVQVEDHPVEYGKFEGRIPEGEYGGGDVIVLDRGTWSPMSDDVDAAIKKGKLEFELDGEKLSGEWVLVRSRRDGNGKPQWLLIKRSDDSAKTGAAAEIVDLQPDSVVSGRAVELREDAATSKQSATKPSVKKTVKKVAKKSTASKVAKSSAARKSKVVKKKRSSLPKVTPQLATLVDSPPSGDDWVHEIKFDGYRLLAYGSGGTVKLVTRNQLDWTEKYTPVAEALADLDADDYILDGELVALLPNGVSSFQRLQHGGNEATSPLKYYAFDLLWLNGEDLRNLPLRERKQRLRALLPRGKSSRVEYSDHVEGDGQQPFEHSCKLGLEGIISKRADRAYVGGRGLDWVKSKCLGREELVVGGWTDSSAGPRGLGALLVGYFADGEFKYAGRVGTGYTDAISADLLKRLGKLSQAKASFVALPAKEKRGNVHWVKPSMVVEVQFTGWTDSAVMRHPAFLGLREDKPAEKVTTPASLAPKELPMAAKKSSAAKESRKAKGAKSSAPKPESVDAQLTHPEKVLYPQMGLTKHDLAEYYSQIAPLMLPHIIDRPLSLVRCPGGQKSKCFFQKHAGPGTSETLGRIEIDESGETREYLYVRNLDGLLSLVQQSVLEIHVWGSQRDRVEFPDRAVIDLDPDEGLPWSKVRDAALLVRDLLQEIGLKSFVKTTGGKGLHVVFPMNPRRHDWDYVKAFTKAIAEGMTQQYPKQFTSNMAKAARTGKIFVDYLRNGHGATAVAPYSTRAKPGATVSTPIAWDELSTLKGPDLFPLEEVLKRVGKKWVDPWEGIEDVKQTLPKIT